MTQYRIIKPLDVLFFRGNRLFGGAGEHGYSTMPPWPSVFTGAVGSRILADHGLLSKATAKFEKAADVLKEKAGENFGCSFLGIEKKGRVFMPVPADIVVCLSNNELKPYSLSPVKIPKGITSSNNLPLSPVLRIKERKKPITGLWLDLTGWEKHLNEQAPPSSCFISQNQLWTSDPRLGIGLDDDLGTASEGKIYTSDAIALSHDASFFVGFKGKAIPGSGIIRLGGDGRGAIIEKNSWPETLETLGQPREEWSGFRMIFTTPGIFPGGWLPPLTEKEGNDWVLKFKSLKARLMAAAISRHGVVSGWDIARHKPKPAEKTIPAGSVYWFKILEGNVSELKTLWEHGLYSAMTDKDETQSARQREGFGRVWFGKWETIKEDE